MKLLSIETSTKNFSLAVSDEEKVLRHRNVKLRRVLSSSIMPGIERILADAGIGLKDLDGLAVGLGPGSFTSLRVGLSTVKALAYAGRKPIIGIPSPDILAVNALGQGVEDIAVVNDARRGLVYACLYRNAGGRLQRKTDYLLLNIRDFLARIQGKTIFVGDALGLYKDTILKALKKESAPAMAPENLWFPQAKAMVPLAAERFRRKKFDDLDRLVPLYLYPEDCQVKQS